MCALPLNASSKIKQKQRQNAVKRASIDFGSVNVKYKFQSRKLKRRSSWRRIEDQPTHTHRDRETETHRPIYTEEMGAEKKWQMKLFQAI